MKVVSAPAAATGSKPSSSSPALAAGAIPSERRHPGHRGARVDLAQGHRAVALGQPRAVRAEHERHVRVGRRAAARARGRARAGAAWSPARSAPRTTSLDALGRVVDHDREVVGAAPSLRRTTKSSTTPVDAAEQAVLEADPRRRRRGRAAPAGGPPRAARAARRASAAGTSPGRRPRAAGRAAPTPPRGSPRACRSTRRQPVGRAALQRGGVELQPRGLEHDLAVPVEPDRRQVGELLARPSRRARGPCRGPPCARGSARRPSARTATPAAPCAGCRGAGPGRARGEAAVGAHTREGQRVGDLGQRRRVAVALRRRAARRPRGHSIPTSGSSKRMPASVAAS